MTFRLFVGLRPFFLRFDSTNAPEIHILECITLFYLQNCNFIVRTLLIQRITPENWENIYSFRIEVRESASVWRVSRMSVCMCVFVQQLHVVINFIGHKRRANRLIKAAGK